MAVKPWESWERSLDKYRYPVNLANFEDANKYPGWFWYDTGEGGPSETKAFEDRFRKNAPYHLEVWYEVVYWKMNSQGGRSNRTTRGVISRIEKLGVTAEDLWDLCQRYVNNPSWDSFDCFRKKLVRTKQVAVAATFPSFVDPATFPMVDTQVARWARKNSAKYSYKQCALSPGPNLSDGVTTLRYDLRKHKEFVESWHDWCRFTVRRLTRLTGREWRARDVEMAVFTAQRKGISLSPL